MNGGRAGAGVSRGRSTESNEPANPDGLTTREGLNLAGRTRPSVVLSRSDEADRLSIWAAIIMAEKEWLLHPLRTARNRRTRTRMYGGVGARRGNPPGDPIRHGSHFASRICFLRDSASAARSAALKLGPSGDWSPRAFAVPLGGFGGPPEKDGC